MATAHVPASLEPDSRASDPAEVTSSTEFVTAEEKFSDSDKESCARLLQCIEAPGVSDEHQYHTWTSHWNENDSVSSAAYTLMNIKRWYLADEQFLFDPLKQNACLVQLNAETALWPKFEEAGEITIPVTSVDAILMSKLSQSQVEAVRHLDGIMSEIDCADLVNSTDTLRITKLLKESASNPAVKEFISYRDFAIYLNRALLKHCQPWAPMIKSIFKETFIHFVACILTCFDHGFSVKDHGFLLDQLVLGVEMDDGLKSRLQVFPQPDALVLDRVGVFSNVLIAMAEVKGLMNQTAESDDGERDWCENPLHKHDSDDEESDSDDEESDSDDEESHRTLKKSKCQNSLHKRTKVVNQSEQDAEVVETELEKLVKDVPVHLERITELPPHARKGIKMFLPQLLGDMWHCPLSKTATGLGEMRWFSSRSGLKFGIGVVIFDVYFVTMMDASQSSSESDSLVNSAEYTNVFVTRPFKLLLKKDRRTIIKVLVAALFLDTYEFI